MLRRLKVQNYKSLKDVEIAFQPLTVLVGPNGAGKSNILDCFSFLSELTKGHRNADTVVTQRGGFSDLVWGGDKQGAIRFELEETLEGFGRNGREAPLTYGLALTLSPQNAMTAIPEEWARMGDPRGPLNTLLERKGDLVTYVGSSSSRNQPWETGLSDIPPSAPLELFALQAAMQSWRVYDFQRPQIVLPQPVKRETRLAPDGSNAATVLHWLRNADPDAFERLESQLKDAIPEVERLLTPPAEQAGYTYIAFKERAVPGRIPAWNLSEGSARLVATLLAMFVPEPPALVAIESPDTALHPGLMEYLAEILKLGSKHTQVVITTHSPYLLNHLPPESLLIVTKKRGATKVKPVKKNQALKEALKVLGLGEIWYAGHLGGVP